MVSILAVCCMRLFFHSMPSINMGRRPGGALTNPPIFRHACMPPPKNGALFIPSSSVSASFAMKSTLRLLLAPTARPACPVSWPVATSLEAPAKPVSGVGGALSALLPAAVRLIPRRPPVLPAIRRE